MKILFTLLSFIFCLFCIAQNNAVVRKTIDSLNVEIEKAFNENDMVKVASFYADDAANSSG
jgi:hypothetical protein